jgi:hypothetical protein
MTVTAAASALLLTAGTAHADLTPAELRTTTDQYLFALSLDDFTSTRAQQPHAGQLDWSSDGCSASPDTPFGYGFTHPCDRHDFGYRNYPKQERFTEENRLRIDDTFKADLYHACGNALVCKGIANIYYFAVREFGGPDVSTAEAVDKAHITSILSAQGKPVGFHATNRRGERVEFHTAG